MRHHAGRSAVRVGVHQVQPRQLGALEGLPYCAWSVGLAQPVRHGPPGARVQADAKVAGHHLDIFGVWVVVGRRLDAAAPGHHAVGARVDAGGGHGGCLGQVVVFGLALDAAAAEWPLARADAMLCINMVHISPWQATLGLFAGAARLLASNAPLYLYGPFHRAGVTTAESNLAFDANLRARDPTWGLRAVEDVTAAAQGFELTQLVEMPANNLSLVYVRR